MAVEFWWWPMSPWLSPGAACFIFFNVVVGAIAVMSRGEQGGRASTARRRLARTASTVVMERLRSVSIFSFHSAADYSVASSPASQLHHVQDQYYYYTSHEQEAEEEELVSWVAPELGKPEPAPVAGESGASATTAAPSAPVATTAAAADAAESASESEEDAEDGEESISLDEAYALARQRHAQARQSPPAAFAAVAHMDMVARPRKREPAKVAEVERRAYVCGRGADEAEGKAEVNARAERFIRQFREELKLQRLNSNLNHTHALRRGVGSAEAR